MGIEYPGNFSLWQIPQKGQQGFYGIPVKLPGFEPSLKVGQIGWPDWVELASLVFMFHIKPKSRLSNFENNVTHHHFSSSSSGCDTGF
jgi:hypothetical protein